MSRQKIAEWALNIAIFIGTIASVVYAVKSYRLQKIAFDRDNPAIKTYSGYWYNTNLVPGGEAKGVSVNVLNDGRQLLMVSRITIRFKDDQGSAEEIEMKAENVGLDGTFNLAPGESKSLNSGKLNKSQFQSVEQSGEIVVTDIAGGEVIDKYSAIRTPHL